MKNLQSFNLIIVTVTYGSRGNLLKQLLSSIKSSSLQAYNIIIVFNGPGDRITEFENINYPKILIHCLINYDNLGSAAGYAQGIIAAQKLGASHVLLIDDDNVILEGALDALQASVFSVQDNIILALNRITRKKYSQYISGKGGNGIYKSNRCLGVGLKFFESDLGGRFELQSLPYSGLVIPIIAVNRVGLPDTMFFLYQDDRDYTYRLWLKGYRFLILKEARIADIDESWETSKSLDMYRFFPSILHPNSNDLKVYHSVRSRVIFNLKHQVTSNLRYRINAMIFMILIIVLGFLLPVHMSIRRIKTIKKAVSDGLKEGLSIRNKINHNIDG